MTSSCLVKHVSSICFQLLAANSSCCDVILLLRCQCCNVNTSLKLNLCEFAISMYVPKLIKITVFINLLSVMKESYV
jgi:hypothetical protein